MKYFLTFVRPFTGYQQIEISNWNELRDRESKGVKWNDVLSFFQQSMNARRRAIKLSSRQGLPLEPNYSGCSYRRLPSFCRNHQREASGNASDTIHQIPDQC